MSDAAAGVFDEHLRAWRSWQETPWGRLRYRVVAETLARICADLDRHPLSVLDVGGADGGDALPLAVLGHRITILDQSAPLLGQALSGARDLAVENRVTCIEADLDTLDDRGIGTFDLVVCHNVVQYRADLTRTVALLAGRVARAGALSLLAPNPAADVMSAAIAREEPDEALRLLAAEMQRTATFDHDVRRIPVEAAVSALAAHGLSSVTMFGILAVTHLVPNERKADPTFYADLEALELELFDREPYLRTARFWQVIGRRA